MTSPGAQTYADSRAAILLVGLICGGLSVAAIVVTLQSPIVDHPVYYASLRGFFMFGLIALGLYGWAREPERGTRRCCCCCGSRRRSAR